MDQGCPGARLNAAVSKSFFFNISGTLPSGGPHRQKILPIASRVRRKFS